MLGDLRDRASVSQLGLHMLLKYVPALLAFACLKGASAQQQPSPLPDFRIRISVNLVQVDATVTDSRGKPVSDLTAGDFQILLDGRPQTIVSSNFIQAGGDVQAPPAAVAPPSVPRKLAAALPPMPAAPLKREHVRRTVVFFVDDLSMSSESVPAVRNGLRKFIEQQLQPGDLAAVVRASAGLGALQDFTNDRRLLLAATSQVRWNPLGRGRMSAYTQAGNNPSEGLIMSTTLGQEETISIIRNYTVAVASSLRRLVHGMSDLPGRKSVVILSDSLPIRTPDDTEPLGTQSILGNSATAPAVGSGTGGPILAGIRGIIDESVRAGVVIYAIDTRGLNSLRAQAADRPSPAGAPEFAGPGGLGGGMAQPGGDWVWNAIQGRRREYSEGQWGAMLLATQTGGFMVTEANFIDAGIEQVMNDQSGYYLLSFTPPPAALAVGRDGKPVYHRLKVGARRDGLRVRSHQGFFGVADDDLASAAPHPELQLAASLESPFRQSGVGMEIQSGFLNARKNDSFIRTAVILDGRDLTISGPPIHRTGVFHLMVRAFAVSGDQIPGGINQTLRIDLNEEGYERALKYGLLYTALLPVAKPGPYQVRAACRDESTGKMGSASDFVVVPKLNGLALSGIVFQHLLGVENHVRPAAGARSYTPGERAGFAFQVINPPDAPLIMRTRLFRDGRQVHEGPPQPVDARSAKVAGRFFTHSAIEIPGDLAPGDYLLRVDVEDRVLPPRQTRAWQWAWLSGTSR
jgi:VWFA-related protein